MNRALGGSNKFYYKDDFGDLWRHEVEFVKVRENESNIKCPICIDGENVCPSEDCGGPHGFEDLKKALADKEAKMKEELLEWLGDFTIKELLIQIWLIGIFSGARRFLYFIA